MMGLLLWALIQLGCPMLGTMLKSRWEVLFHWFLYLWNWLNLGSRSQMEQVVSKDSTDHFAENKSDQVKKSRYEIIFHLQFRCCGVLNQSDWDTATQWNKTMVVSGSAITAVVPVSCCTMTDYSYFPDQLSQITFTDISACLNTGSSAASHTTVSKTRQSYSSSRRINYFDSLIVSIINENMSCSLKGCYQAIYDKLKSYSLAIAILGIIVGVIQVSIYNPLIYLHIFTMPF